MGSMTAGVHAGGTNGSSRRLRVLLLAAVAGLLLALFGAGGPVAAQDEGNGEAIQGTLRTRDADGEFVFVADVTFTVTDAEGNEVGVAVTDGDGVWLVPVPGPGFYDVLLDESTLPDGLPLRNPEKNPLNVEVTPGAVRNTLFPLGDAQVTSDNTIKAVQLFVDGVKLGMIIAMCAVGLSLIYGTTGLTNFAHGEMVTFGAMIAYLFHVSGVFGITTSLIVAAILAFAIAGLAGGAMNAGIWHPLRNRGASLISQLVVSIGLSIFFRYVMLYLFAGRARFFSDYRIQEQIDFGVFNLVPKDLFIIVFSTLVLLGIGLALQKTRAGKAMRAVSDNKDLAESSGIDVERVIMWVWVSGSALAGLGGVLFGLTENINWEMGFRLLLLMFAGVTLGGLGSAYGALVGSLVVGIFIQMSTLFIPSDMKNVGALVMLIVILLIRPQGLLGRSERVG